MRKEEVFRKLDCFVRTIKVPINEAFKRQRDLWSGELPLKFLRKNNYSKPLTKRVFEQRVPIEFQPKKTHEKSIPCKRGRRQVGSSDLLGEMCQNIDSLRTSNRGLKKTCSTALLGVRREFESLLNH